MTRKDTLDEGFILLSEVEVEGIKVYPASVQRVRFLKVLKNPEFIESDREIDAMDATIESVYVMTLSESKIKQSYVDFKLNGYDDWTSKVDDFVMDAPPRFIEKVVELIKEENERLKYGAVEGLGKGEAQ